MPSAPAKDNKRRQILWANLHLLFWLSLVPFVTGWMGENHFASLPTAVYGGVLFFSGIAYVILQGAIIADQGKGSNLAAAVGRNLKGKLSAALYAAAIPMAFLREWIADAILVPAEHGLAAGAETSSSRRISSAKSSWRSVLIWRSFMAPPGPERYVTTVSAPSRERDVFVMPEIRPERGAGFHEDVVGPSPGRHDGMGLCGRRRPR